MDDERALRVLCDLEEGFALFEVEAANRLRVSDVEPGLGVEIDARSIGERQELKAADGGGLCVWSGEALVDRDADQDRNRVVTGKSVSVRVHVGGRRVIK